MTDPELPAFLRFNRFQLAGSDIALNRLNADLEEPGDLLAREEPRLLPFRLQRVDRQVQHLNALAKNRVLLA